ncbi:MAG: hypothetical protein ACK5WZ_08995 [Pseudobdellovibrionaceae bacterium]
MSAVLSSSVAIANTDLQTKICANISNAQTEASSNFRLIKDGVCNLINETSDEKTKKSLGDICAASNSDMKASLRLFLRGADRIGMPGLDNRQQVILKYIAITAIVTEVPEAFNPALQENGCL